MGAGETTYGRGMLGRRQARVLLSLGLLVLAATGCGVVRGTISTVRALQKAGFSSATIHPRTGDTIAVEVKKDTEDLDLAAADAAGVVWRKLPLRVERLEVTCGNGFGGKGRFAADRAGLEQRFGARDPVLDRGFQESDFRTVAIVLGVLFLGGLLVLAGVIVLVVVLVRRNRGRTPPPGPPPPPAGRWQGASQPPPPGYRRPA